MFLCLPTTFIACGEAICSRAESSYASISKKLKDCAPSGQKYFQFVADRTRCDITIKTCSDADKKILTNNFDCTDKLPACTADTYGNFSSSVTTCGSVGSLSTGCIGAVAGFVTTSEETKP